MKKSTWSEGIMLHVNRWQPPESGGIILWRGCAHWQHRQAMIASWTEVNTVMSVILVKYWKSLRNASAKPIAPLAARWHFLRITVTQVACDLLSLLLCTWLFTSAFSWTCRETLLSKLWPDRTSCFIQRQTNIQFHCHHTPCLSSSKLRTVWL